MKNSPTGEVALPPLALSSEGRRAAAHSSPRSNPRDVDGVIKARLIHVDSHALIPLVYLLIFAILPTEGYSQTPPIQNVMTSHVLTGCNSFIPLIVANRGLSYLLRYGLWGPVNCNQESTVTGALGAFSRWRQPRGAITLESPISLLGFSIKN